MSDVSTAGGPDWWRDAIVYQVYVRSFADSTGDGVGDLDGIRSHLDHIAGLGADAIWLNPCYPSPQRDHGYDVADYFDIDPTYGTLESFDALVVAAHARGLRVLMDVVPNHCSSDHPWFRAALASPRGSAERNRFWFRDGRGHGDDEPPNNWLAGFGGSAWTRVADLAADGDPDASHTDAQWYLGTFSEHQPDLNHTNPDVQAMFADVLEFWFDRGVDGFRVDAIQPIGKHPELPDQRIDPDHDPLSVPWENEYQIFRPEGHDVWRGWRRTITDYEARHPGRELMLVAEAYMVRRPDLMVAFTGDDQFHQVFAFDLMLSPWNRASIERSISDPISAYADSGAPPAWTLNNHDTQRIVTRLGRAEATDAESWTDLNLLLSAKPGDQELGERRSRAAIVFTAALPGSLYLYQGEELGLPEVLELPDDVRQDPAFFGTDGATIGRDGCRVPLPWIDDPTVNHGFSASDGRSSPAPPWLPQPPDWGRFAAATEAVDPDSILELYRRLGAARRALRGMGDDLVLLDVAATVVAFRRSELVVVLNVGAAPIDLAETSLADVVQSASVVIASAPDAHIPVLAPDACLWLR